MHQDARVCLPKLHSMTYHSARNKECDRPSNNNCQLYYMHG
jgi:hypothetical protein